MRGHTFCILWVIRSKPPCHFAVIFLREPLTNWPVWRIAPPCRWRERVPVGRQAALPRSVAPGNAVCSRLVSHSSSPAVCSQPLRTAIFTHPICKPLRRARASAALAPRSACRCGARVPVGRQATAQKRSVAPPICRLAAAWSHSSSASNRLFPLLVRQAQALFVCLYLQPLAFVQIHQPR